MSILSIVSSKLIINFQPNVNFIQVVVRVELLSP